MEEFWSVIYLQLENILTTLRGTKYSMASRDPGYGFPVGFNLSAYYWVNASR